MKNLLKLSATLTIAAFIAAPFTVAAQQAGNAVGIKCEVAYHSNVSGGHQRVVPRMKIDTVRNGNAAIYNFDHVETLQISGKPSLLVRMEGHYTHQEESISFLRYSTSVCETKPLSTDLNCFGENYSADISAHIQRAGDGNVNKKVIFAKTAVTAVDLEKSVEVRMKYRLQTGRDLLKDLDTNDPIQREKYMSLISPVVGVNCSVKDEAHGVEYSF